MTVKINKPALNLREELNELNKPSGITGESLLRADTDADARATLGIDNFEQVSVSTDGVISADGLDVTGTATMDGLTVDGGATTTLKAGGFTQNSVTVLELAEYRDGSNNLHYGFKFKTDGAGDNNFHLLRHSNSTTGNKALSVDRDTGDISFYEDTGTTPKMVWNAAAESLGIGTSSPTYTLDVASGASNNQALARFSSSGGIRAIINTDSDDDGSLSLYDKNDAAKVLIRSLGSSYLNGGNVGIGTSLPNLTGFGTGANGLEIADATLAGIRLNGNAADSMYFVSGSGRHWLFGKGAVPMTFSTNGTERMRIDASGNLLVGKTVGGALGTAGIELRPNNLYVTSDNSIPIYVNRKTSDGTIVDFRKDGTSVGSIGSQSGHLYISGNGANSAGLRLQNNGIISPTTNAVVSGDTVDIGQAGARFRNIYLSGGVVFGATGGSVSSKTLDDYEEGTWTPAYTATSGSVTMGFVSGSYTKVGNLVTLYGRIEGKKNTASGTITITGLPFASVLDSGTMSIGVKQNFLVDRPDLVGRTLSSSISLRANPANATGPYLLSATDLRDTATTNNTLTFTVTYKTNS